MRVTPWRELRVEPDGGRIAALDAARERAGSPLAAIERWDIDALLGREVTDEAPATFEEMLPLWVGKAALREAAPERVEAYRSFLGEYGLAERFMAILDDAARDRGHLLECDLGPAHDFVLLKRYLERLPEEGQLVIVEAGGGYGPLAELVLRYGRRCVCFVLADAIAESVFYSWAFLRARLPEARIGAAFLGDVLRPAEQDVFVVPSWELPLAVPAMDAFVNIASLQEMPDAAAHAYLDFCARRLRLGGLAFLENSRDQFYAREYPYPAEWRYLLKRRSPRSRSLDYPVDILERTEDNQDAANRPVIERYYVEMKQAAAAQLHAQAQSLKAQARELAQLRRQAAAERAALTSALRNERARALRELRAKHAGEIAALRQRLATEVAARKSVQAKLVTAKHDHAARIAALRAATRRS
jgi:hypothetical protein